MSAGKSSIIGWMERWNVSGVFSPGSPGQVAGIAGTDRENWTTVAIRGGSF